MAISSWGSVTVHSAPKSRGRLSLGRHLSRRNRYVPRVEFKLENLKTNPWRIDGGLKVQRSELNSIGKTSIKLPDGSGYLGLADVFHQLHCLVSTYSIALLPISLAASD